MLIEKKTWPRYFEKLKSREKNFEVRLADFNIKTGDTLLLREWNPKTKKYTGRSIKKKVTYIVKTKNFKFHTPEEVERYGYYVIALK